MVEKEGLSPADRISQYLEAHPELEQDDAKVDDPVKIENKDIFRKIMVASIRKSVPKFLEAKEDKFLKIVRLDSSIPLDLHIHRGSRIVEGKESHSVLYFHVKKEGQEENVAEFALRDYGDEFRFGHRKVSPQYRENGIATFALEGIEEFVKEYSRKVPGRKAVIEANAAQLDVLRYFDRNGFETTMDDVPVHPGENEIKIHNLDDLIASLENDDGRYKIGPHKYVFPSEYQGSYYQQGKEEIADNVEIDESALVHFRKELDVESGEEERGGVKRWLRGSIRALLNR